MKKILFAGIMICFGALLFGQSPVGTWKTIDDETGDAKSYVEITQASNGTLQGKVVKILTPGKENKKCTDCKGAKKDKPILGMEILWGLEKDGDGWSGGKILDPNKGKEYKCKMSLKDNNTLDVRGYIGFSLIGRTQTWYRVE